MEWLHAWLHAEFAGSEVCVHCSVQTGACFNIKNTSSPLCEQCAENDSHSSHCTHDVSTYRNNIIE